jgi:hypothetical protein
VELGFDTIGNATLIVYDRGPLLVTDPWIEGDAYFGSWTRSHQIPEAQRDAIIAAPFCWISHGHPDHLSMASLRAIRATTILLADHVGGRLASALRDAGFAVSVLRDRTWTELSERVRVCTMADYNQDSILLVDIDGCLVIDMNDAQHRGTRAFVRDAASRSRTSFLLQQVAFGDADMINLFDEAGERIPPRAAQRPPLGHRLAALAAHAGARFVIPFSAMHRYQRADSVWANEHITGIEDYGTGFESEHAELLPAYTRYDAIADGATRLDPVAEPTLVLPPEAFGDNWSEPLDDDDRRALDGYIGGFAHVTRSFEFIGERHVVPLGGRGARGITFAAPRHSLMAAVRHHVFDDLMIGNFVRTTVHGKPDPDALYPDFTPYVSKYGDNGEARSAEELRQYFRAYRTRAPFDYLRHRLERLAVDRVRGLVPRDSRAFRLGQRAYQRLQS